MPTDGAAALLLIFRHSESQGNRSRIIQGQEPCTGLTEDGRAHAALTATAIASMVNGARLWSSDSRRAIETATSVGAALGVTPTATRLVREVDPGVLAGLTHAEAAARHPDAYAIWVRRGDLDGIQGAETGGMLQARTLAALACLAGGEEDGRPAVVISHAAFLRCFVNTVRSRPRDSHVEVAHGYFHLVSDPWARLGRRRISAPWRATAFRVRTLEAEYQVKRFRPPPAVSAEAYAATVQAAYVACLGTCRAPFMAGDPACHGTIVSVRPWIDGTHYFGSLDSARAGQLARMLGGFHAGLRMVSRRDDGRYLPAATDSLTRYAVHLENHDRAAFDELMERRGPAMTCQARQIIVDMDVHRENIVFATDAAHKIDCDSLCRAPAELQLASSLVGAYLLEGHPLTGALLQEICPEGTDMALVRDFALLRAFRGLGYFAGLPRDQLTPARDHAVLYRRAIAWLCEFGRSTLG